MSEIEHALDMHEEENEGDLAIAAFAIVQELTMDEDLEVDRPDVWYGTWVDLQQPVEGYIDASEAAQRETARTQIHKLYIESLEALYPQLAKVETMNEFNAILATIPDVPPCDGTFSSSTYEAANGNQRSLVYVDARLGDQIAMAVYISDVEPQVIHSYKLTMLPDMTIIGGSVITLRDTEQAELELLSKIEPRYRNMLLSIMYGNMLPDEVEMRLIEIKVMSMGIAPEAELDEIISHAHACYMSAVEQHNDEVAIGMMQLTKNDFCHMHEILEERMIQLG